MAIVIEQDGGSKIHCSGSIIDEKTVLTAAHCFVNPDDPGSVDTDKMKIIGRDLFLLPIFFSISFVIFVLTPKLPQLYGRIFRPSDVCKKLSHHFFN